jgi:dipeptidyl aminopeptidase/acylaminoacyl peptidase
VATTTGRRAACGIFRPTDCFQSGLRHFSAAFLDGQWIVFEACSHSRLDLPASTLYVVPASGGPWTPITDGKQWDDKPNWSPDGRLIYFVSRHGAFFNVWGIRFDPNKGKPVGDPFQITHLDGPDLMVPQRIDPVELSVARDRLVLTVAQVAGNIWLLDNVDR